MPFVVGAIGLLFLRAAVHGRMASLVDVIVLYGYFAAFSLWSFGYKLYSYGHNLAPTAAVKVPPLHAADVRLQAARELRGLLVSRGRVVRARRLAIVLLARGRSGWRGTTSTAA